MAAVRIIAGLGNPGREYAKTYHNIGLIFVTWLAAELKIPFRKGVIKTFEYAKNSVRLVRPLTFMNVSGDALRAALKTFKAKPQELLLVHDDSDIPLGSYKLAFARGAAGHHGVESVIKALGTKNFFRLRIGVRAPKHGSLKAERLVLRSINEEELKIFHGVFGQMKTKLTENEKPSGSGLMLVKGKLTFS